MLHQEAGKSLPEITALDARDWRFVLALTVLGAAARMLVAGVPPDVDAAGYYLRRAQEILRPDLWPIGPWGYWIHPPGISLMVAPAIILGFGYMGAQLLVALVSASAIPAIWLVGRAAGSSRYSACAWALIICLAPALFFSGAQVLPEVPLVAITLWMMWAVQKDLLTFAAFLGVTAVLVKEEALVLSALGFLSVIIRRHEGGGIRRWLLPVAVSVAALGAWWGLAWIYFGFLSAPTNPYQAVLVRESAFHIRQLTHPEAVLRHAALLVWQSLFLIGAATVVPLVIGIWCWRPRSIHRCLSQHAVAVSSILIALVLFALHCFVAEATLVRYQLPTAALIIGAAASAGWPRGDRARRVYAASLRACALAAIVMLCNELVGLRGSTSVSTTYGKHVDNEFDEWSKLPGEKSMWAILTWRQSNVSARLYQDAWVLQEIERLAASRGLVFSKFGEGAPLIFEISKAMGHDFIQPGRAGSNRGLALLLTEATPRNCRLAISSILSSEPGARDLRVTHVRFGDARAYIVEGAPSAIACPAGF